MSAKKLKVHFIGVGGIGGSALAKYYLTKGWQVTGSDLLSSEITEALKKQGAKVFIGLHKAKCLTPGVKQVIYSPAIPKNNPELKKAKELGIKCLSYPEALGELTKKYFTIAVSGTHGKSTTTAMIGLLLTKAGFDPTVIVGTKLKEFGDSNCRVGKSKYLVIEADEHFASFLNYWPKIIVATTIDVDHLDYYKNLNNILKTFKKYIGHLPKDGYLVANKDNENISKILPPHQNLVKIQNYSLKQSEAKKLREILKIPGKHNISNALATLKVARLLKIPDKVSFKALSEYKGAWRRFEIKRVKIIEDEKCSRPVTAVSDYGHHPTEIRVTLKAAREKFPKKKIWLVYQPHQYQRTYYLFKDFVNVFREAPVDKVVITDIFDVAGRENKEIKKKVNSERLVKAVNRYGDLQGRQRNGVIYLPKSKILNHLKKNLRGGEVVIIMGAGDIYKLCQQF